MLILKMAKDTLGKGAKKIVPRMHNSLNKFRKVTVTSK
jgi:hypothetical protein